MSIALRDHLVCGLFSEALQQKIPAEADLALARAVEPAVFTLGFRTGFATA